HGDSCSVHGVMCPHACLRHCSQHRSRQVSPLFPVQALVLPSSLTVSVVTYRPVLPLFERCLATLAVAVAAARSAGTIDNVVVALIDNSEDRDIANAVIKLGQARFQDSGVRMTHLHEIGRA